MAISSTPDAKEIDQQGPRVEAIAQPVDAEPSLAENNTEALLERGGALYASIDLGGVNKFSLDALQRGEQGGDGRDPAADKKLLDLAAKDPSLQKFLVAREEVADQQRGVTDAQKQFDAAREYRAQVAASNQGADRALAQALLEQENPAFSDADFEVDTNALDRVTKTRAGGSPAYRGGGTLQELMAKDEKAAAFLDRQAADPAFKKESERRTRLSQAREAQGSNARSNELALDGIAKSRAALETAEDTLAAKKFELAEFVSGQELERGADIGAEVRGAFSKTYDKGIPQAWTVKSRNGNELTLTRTVDGVVQLKPISIQAAAKAIARFGGGLRS